MCRRLIGRLVPALALALVGPLLVTGCGGKKSSLSGKVTLDNKTVVAAQVHFVDGEGKKQTAILSPEGKYQIELPPGDYKLAVEAVGGPTMKMPGVGQPSTPPKGVGEMKDPTGQVNTKIETGAIKLTHQLLPMRYKSPDSSGLSVKVTAGSQTHDIPLTSK